MDTAIKAPQTIRVDPETYAALLRRKARLEAETGRVASLSDAVKAALRDAEADANGA